MSYNLKVMVSGFALLLFGIIAAINQSFISYVTGALGLLFVMAGCFTKEDKQ